MECGWMEAMGLTSGLPEVWQCHDGELLRCWQSAVGWAQTLSGDIAAIGCCWMEWCELIVVCLRFLWCGFNGTVEMTMIWCSWGRPPKRLGAPGALSPTGHCIDGKSLAPRGRSVPWCWPEIRQLLDDDTMVESFRGGMVQYGVPSAVKSVQLPHKSIWGLCLLLARGCGGLLPPHLRCEGVHGVQGVLGLGLLSEQLAMEYFSMHPQHSPQRAFHDACSVLTPRGTPWGC